MSPLLRCRVAWFLTALVLVTSCSSKPELRAAVPPFDDRLGPFSLSQMDSALGMSICLLRTGSAWDCRSGDDEAVCVLDSPDRVRSRIEPAFRRLPEIRLVSASSAVEDARRLFSDLPGVVPDIHDVVDARRDHSCDDWGCETGAESERCGRCLVLRVDKLWILLHSPKSSADGSLDYFEIFLAEPVCVDEID